jgi:DNA-binding CsgD family transcriptional regulator
VWTQLIQHRITEASIKAAAREGLTNGTAGQYMKRIFKKTGTNNQAQLMKLLLTASIAG